MVNFFVSASPPPSLINYDALVFQIWKFKEKESKISYYSILLWLQLLCPRHENTRFNRDNKWQHWLTGLQELLSASLAERKSLSPTDPTMKWVLAPLKPPGNSAALTGNRVHQSIFMINLPQSCIIHPGFLYTLLEADYSTIHYPRCAEPGEHCQSC